MADDAAAKPKIFLVAVEESGDRLGAALIRALRQRTANTAVLAGVGGRAMAAEGFLSLHDIDNFSLIGVSSIPARLPRILRHMRQTLRALRAIQPDVLVVIDSPGYNLRLARRAHRADPSLPIISYVSPSVWAWRPQRARSMRHFIRHVLALLPFEPEAHRRLGGPPCSYVGHPLVEEVRRLRPDAEEARRRLAEPPIVLVLPGSRSGEIDRLAAVFGDAIGRLRDRVGPIEVVVPTLPHLAAKVTAATDRWPVRPRIVIEPAQKDAALRTARAALAKSGTATLELALAGVPMVAAYRVSAIDYLAGLLLLNIRSLILANLVIGEDVVPQFIQGDCTAEKLAVAMIPLLGNTAERRRQIEAFARLDAIMEIGTRAPAQQAADIVLDALRRPALPFAGTTPNL
jgi:lipid-A-disaccharide synthase